MKVSKYIHLSLLAAGTLMGVSACNDTVYEIDTSLRNDSDQLVDIVLPISTPSSKVVTRAMISEAAESEYEDLWVFFFDEQGNRQQLARRNSKQDTIHVTLREGNYQIYAVANLTSNSERGTLSQSITKVQDLRTLKEVIAHLELHSVFRNSGHLLMSGVYDDDNENTPEGFATVKVGNTMLQPIRLERLDARITFHFGLDPSVSKTEHIKFESLKWQVFNVPADTHLFPEEGQEASQYFSMEQPVNFENDTISAETGVSSSTFTFYTLPNSKRGTGATQWSDRERRNETGFINAPENSTYVQLTGLYSRTYNDENNVQHEQRANVQYTIHLGYIGDDCNNNYEVNRNTSYTYNILVNGIKNIKVEVFEGESSDPTEEADGADGTVTESRFCYDFDCHYDREIFHFNKEEIEQHPERMGFYVKTPFDENYYYVANENPNNPLAKPVDQARDFKWVTFRRNNKTTTQVYSDKTYAAYHPDEVITIDQLLEELHRGTDTNGNSIYDPNNNVYYTMFIEEYYYETNPIDGSEAPQDFWKQFVNTEPREMYFLCDYHISKDEKSSWSSAYIQLRQRSIKTIYNTHTGSELQTAWGVETINEPGPTQIAAVNPWLGSTNPDNAIDNQFQALSLVGERWNSFLTENYVQDVKYHNQLTNNSEYDAFLYAMIQRNRDLNGDGIINANELKWFTATSNQYNSLWIGHNALPNESRLYANGTRDYVHYLSSDGRVFLAEEGGTTTSYGWDLNASADLGFMKQKQTPRYDHRCVRMLGFRDEDYASRAIPQSYAMHDKANHSIDLTFLDAESRRPDDFHFDDEMESSHADDYLNVPYTRFEYADVDATLPYYAADILMAMAERDESPCADLNKDGQKGWRLPNEREMDIMLNLLDEGWDDCANSTCYYLTRSYARSFLDRKQGAIYMGAVDSANHQYYITLPSQMQRVRVRCVRDQR